MDQGGLFEAAIDKLPNNVLYDDGVYFNGKIVYTSMGIPACDLHRDKSAVTTKGKLKWVWYWTPLRDTPFMKWFRFFVYMYKDGKLKGSNIFESGIFSYDLGEWSWTGFDIAGDVLSLNPGRTDLYSVVKTEDVSSTETFDQSEELFNPTTNSDSGTDSSEAVESKDQRVTDDRFTIDTATGEQPNDLVNNESDSRSSNADGSYEKRALTSADAYWNDNGRTTSLVYGIGYMDENNIFHPANDYYEGKFDYDETVTKYIATLINDNVSDGIQEAEKPTFDFSEWDE